MTHHWPQFLPGGDAVLFTASSSRNQYTNAHIVVHSLESGETKIVHRGGFLARYLESGHLVYAHDGTLFAAPFDSSRMELTGLPFPALDHMVTRSVIGAGQFLRLRATAVWSTCRERDSGSTGGTSTGSIGMGRRSACEVSSMNTST